MGLRGECADLRPDGALARGRRDDAGRSVEGPTCRRGFFFVSYRDSMPGRHGGAGPIVLPVRC